MAGTSALAWGQEPPPPAGDDIDILTEAGEFQPPPRRASIDLDDTGPKMRWDPRWRRFDLGNFIATGIAAGGAIGSLAIPPAPNRWTTTNEFDVAVRNALRRDETDDRFRERDASDILLALSINQLLVDTLIVTWWGHDAGSVALQMALINIETIAFNAAINGLVSGLASRERPYGDSLCLGEADTELVDCRTSKRYRSFYSGHTSTTFAVAGLTCMHHAYLPIYGDTFADTLICISSFGIAAATGTLRVTGDQHWASDVLVGAAMGTFSGLAVPYFLHYRTGDLPDTSPDTISINLLPTPTGFVMTGVF